MKVALTDAEWARVAELEAIAPEARTIGETAALEALRLVAQSIAAQPELADDPRTLADESRRPDVLTGGDYLDEQRQRDCDAALTAIERLAASIGREALKVLVDRVLYG